jgi:chemotaxis-related protein WspB
VLTSTRIVLAHYRPTQHAQARLLGLILENASETVHYDVAEFAQYGLDNRQAPYLGPVRSTPQGLEQWVHVPDLLPAEVRAQLFPDASSGEAP